MPLIQPYHPLHIPKPIDENIWLVDGPIIHMQQFGLNIPFPTRMTVIRLANNALLLHSPVQPTEALYAALDKLGQVQHLVSPNKIHYASIGVWAKRYPEATCWASPGVRERARKQNIDIRFDHTLGEDAEIAWAKEVDQLVFKGSKFMDEVIFFHKASRTLILADLIENFEAAKVNRFMRWLLKLAGNLDPDGKLPIDLRLTFMGSHAQACQCYQRMLSWHPKRVVLAHGRWYEKDGEKELRRAFRWLSCL